MLQQLKENLTKHSIRNAFYIREQFYTYTQLQQKSLGIATWLNQNNPDKKPVGVIADDDFNTYAAIIGILFSGAAYVPILPSYPKDRSQSIIDQAGLDIILSPLKKEELKDNLNSTEKVTEIDAIATFEGDYTIPNIQQSDYAYILFTSGSTGKPKGVPLTHENLWGFMDSFFALGYELNDEDRFLQMFDLTFDLSVMSYLAPLLVGGCVYTVGNETIKYMSIYSLLEDHELTFTLMVPSMLSYLRPYFDEMEFSTLRYSLFCGEALYAEIAEEWKQCLPNGKVENVYGPTEATIFCLSYDCSGEMKQYNEMVCIGKPMKNIVAIAVDENNQPAQQGEKGELCVTGAQITPGYLNNPEKNAAAFFDLDGVRYYRTGDNVYQDKDGDYMYCGRTDYQVKVKGGFRVELNEIEAHTRHHTHLSNIAAVAQNNDMGIAQIFLFVENYEGNTDELTDYLKTQMPDYMLPERIINVSSFPLNNNGKVDRKQLAATLSSAPNN
jgi:amino acid adenylation domain-containing protein